MSGERERQRFVFFYFNGKISAQHHTTLCIQFLDRENNDKNNTLPLGKQICFTIVWGCAEILPISISNLTLCSIFSLEIVWTVRNKLDDFNRRCSRCRRRRFLNSLLTKRRRQRGRGRGKQKIYGERTIARHVHLQILYTSEPSSAKLQREMIKIYMV